LPPAISRGRQCRPCQRGDDVLDGDGLGGRGGVDRLVYDEVINAFAALVLGDVAQRDRLRRGGFCMAGGFVGWCAHVVLFSVTGSDAGCPISAGGRIAETIPVAGEVVVLAVACPDVQQHRSAGRHLLQRIG